MFTTFLIYYIILTESYSQSSKPYLLYRLHSPRRNTLALDKLVLVNFFGKPGIDVLQMNKYYIDVRILKNYNNSFAKLGLRNGIDIFRRRILNSEYYFGIFQEKLKSHIYKYDFGTSNPSDDLDPDEELQESNKIMEPFTKFLDYDTIVQYLKYLRKRFSSRIFVRPLRKTVHNRTIYAVIIKSGVINSTAVFIEGGTIAREWITINTALYVIKEIGTNIIAYPNLKNLDWIIVPVVNPDGYEYSYNNPEFRMWEKNRNCPTRCKVGTCGVNIDRNFPLLYGSIGSSTNPCSNAYRGLAALSEMESQSIYTIIMANRDTLRLYIGLRSFGNCILYPWGTQYSSFPDARDLRNIARQAANAMYRHRNNTNLPNYTISSYADLKYAASGNIMDFAEGVADIKYSFTIYLRSSTDENNADKKGYRPESKEILAIVQECFEGIQELAEHIYYTYPPPKSNLRLRRNKRKHRLSSQGCIIQCYLVVRYIILTNFYTILLM